MTSGPDFSARISGVSLQQRWGGHGGMSTQWELEATYPHLVAVAHRIPTLFLIQVHHGPYGSSVFLPEGVPWDLAGKAVSAWASADSTHTPSMVRLVKTLTRCQLRGIAFLRHLPIRQRWLDRWHERSLNAV